MRRPRNERRWLARDPTGGSFICVMPLLDSCQIGDLPEVSSPRGASVLMMSPMGDDEAIGDTIE
jgi:hypothetical protein